MKLTPVPENKYIYICVCNTARSSCQSRKTTWPFRCWSQISPRTRHLNREAQACKCMTYKHSVTVFCCANLTWPARVRGEYVQFWGQYAAITKGFFRMNVQFTSLVLAVTVELNQRLPAASQGWGGTAKLVCSTNNSKLLFLFLSPCEIGRDCITRQLFFKYTGETFDSAKAFDSCLKAMENSGK